MDELRAPRRYRVISDPHWIQRGIDYIDSTMNAIERAKELGTYNAIDRSKQYEAVHYPEVLRAVNEAWAKIRQLEAAALRKDQDIAALRTRVSRYKWMNIALTSILTGLAWEGAKALVAYLAYR